MKLVLTDTLQQHLGLLPLRLKGSAISHAESVPPVSDVLQAESPNPINQMPKPELEKNEFRLLVKILQAIDHECVFDNIIHKSGQVIYQHPKKVLVFGDINTEDDQHTMYLSGLSDMNKNPKLKRAVWEKLKTLS